MVIGVLVRAASAARPSIDVLAVHDDVCGVRNLVLHAACAAPELAWDLAQAGYQPTGDPEHDMAALQALCRARADLPSLLIYDMCAGEVVYPRHETIVAACAASASERI